MLKLKYKRFKMLKFLFLPIPIYQCLINVYVLIYKCMYIYIYIYTSYINDIT